MCIFPSDGTSRIRFTGLGYGSHSQPDASGSPKTYLRAIYDHYNGYAENVKKKQEGRCPPVMELCHFQS